MKSADRNHAGSRAPAIAAAFLALACAAVVLAGAPREARAAGTASADDAARMATLFALAGSTTQAESLFTLALSVDSTDAAAHNGLGNLAAIAGRGRVADLYYLSASRLDPADPGIRLNRSLVLENLLGRPEEGAAMWRAAAQEVGGWEAARSLLGYPAPAGTAPAAERGAGSGATALTTTPARPRARPAESRADRPRAILAPFLYWK